MIDSAETRCATWPIGYSLWIVVITVYEEEWETDVEVSVLVVNSWVSDFRPLVIVRLAKELNRDWAIIETVFTE